MAVSYGMRDKIAARKAGLFLVTIAVAGKEFQEAVTEDEERELLEFYLAFTKRRGERLKAEKGEGN